MMRSPELESETDDALVEAGAAATALQGRFARDDLLALARAIALIEVSMELIQPGDADRMRNASARFALELCGVSDTLIDEFKLIAQRADTSRRQ